MIEDVATVSDRWTGMDDSALDVTISFSLRGFGANRSFPDGPGWYLDIRDNEGYREIATMKVDAAMMAAVAVTVDNGLARNLVVPLVSRNGDRAVAYIDAQIERAQAAAALLPELLARREAFANGQPPAAADDQTVAPTQPTLP